MFEYKAQLVKVIDADTVDVLIDLGFHVFIKERLRLAGIDAPEVYGVRKGSKEYLKGLDAMHYVAGRFTENNNECVIRTSKLDKWRRWLALIYLADSDKTLNQELVEEGHATAVDSGRFFREQMSVCRC